MLQVPKAQLAVYVAAALAIVLIGARYLNDSADDGAGASDAPAGTTATTPEDDGGGVEVTSGDGGPALVHVAGEVRRPGVYRVPAGTRVDDAVREAGGPTGRAELGALNLAAKVEDGRQIVVPARGGMAGPGPAGAAPTGAAGADAAGVQGGVAGAGAVPGAPVNLNTATLEQLDTLDGIGPGIAQRILQYRQEHGGFSSIDELNQVPGIGEKRLAALRDLVQV